jgi:hypothetical protein
MPPRRAPTSAGTTTPDAPEVTAAVERLTEEVAAVREVLDGIREEIQWAVRNGAGRRWTAQDDADADDGIVAGDAHSARRNDDSRSRHVLVDAQQFARAMEDVEQLVYCCEAPDLRWNGDPDRPGVACAECGFVVAENGAVVDYVTHGSEPPCRPDALPSMADGEAPDADAVVASSPQAELF